MKQRIESKVLEASQPFLDRCNKQECNCDICNERLQVEEIIRGYYNRIIENLVSVMPIIDLEEKEFWEAVEEFLEEDERINKK